MVRSRSAGSFSSSSTAPSSSSTSSRPSMVGFRGDITYLRLYAFQCFAYPPNLGWFRHRREGLMQHRNRAVDLRFLMRERYEVVGRPLEQEATLSTGCGHHMGDGLVSILEKAHFRDPANAHDQ